MDKRLKIGFFIDTYFPMVDGVVMVVHNYASLLSEFADVTVFCPKVKDYADNYPYRVVRCRTKNLFFLDYEFPSPKGDKAFQKQIADAGLDVVHIHSPFGVGASGARYAKKHGIPAIYTLHSQYKLDFLHYTKSRLLTAVCMNAIAKVFNKADLLLTMNPACRGLARAYGYKGEIKLLPNATDLPVLENRDEVRRRTREKLGIGDREFLLINVGRLSKVKNLAFAIKTVAELKRKSVPAKLIVIGSGGDERYFKRLAEKSKVKDEVMFLGKISDKDEKAALFAAADLHIFPSFYDTDGIVRIEAAAAGTPTIGIEGSISASAITNGVNGFTGANDPAQFANLIAEIKNDPARLAAAGRNAAQQLYHTWDKVVHDLTKIYNDVILNKCATQKN